MLDSGCDGFCFQGVFYSFVQFSAGCLMADRLFYAAFITPAHSLPTPQAAVIFFMPLL
jgi:hypothetical protein